MAYKISATLFVLMMLLASTAHAAIPASVNISLVRAVRVSDTSVSLSFRTNQQAIGKIEYTIADGDTITLTDSTTQVDHLFTIDQLDPSFGYTFVLTAMSGTITSNRYQVLLSPQTIGVPGQSVMPAVQEIAPSGDVVSMRTTSTSTPTTPISTVPRKLLLICAVFVGVVVGYSWLRSKRNVSLSKTDSP